MHKTQHWQIQASCCTFNSDEHAFSGNSVYYFFLPKCTETVCLTSFTSDNSDGEDMFRNRNRFLSFDSVHITIKRWWVSEISQMDYKCILSLLWFESSQQETPCWMSFRVLLLGDLSSCGIMMHFRVGKVKAKFVLWSDAAFLLWWSHQLRAHNKIGESEQLCSTSSNWFVFRSQQSKPQHQFRNPHLEWDSLLHMWVWTTVFSPALK